MTEQTVSETLDNLISTYKELLTECYDALADNADPDRRAALRKALEQFIKE